MVTKTKIPNRFICFCGQYESDINENEIKTCPKCKRIYKGIFNNKDMMIDSFLLKETPPPVEIFGGIKPKNTFANAEASLTKLKTGNLFDIKRVNILTFKDIKSTCVVRSIKKNTCNINRNTSCNQANCVVYSFLNILKGEFSKDSDVNFKFNQYSKLCKVRISNNRCSINSSKPCLAQNCVMFNFLKVVEKNVN